MQAAWVARGEDRFGERFGLGIGTLAFKVTPEDSHGTLVVAEIVHHAKGGPPRHFHEAQEEWFYGVEGEYVVEVGEERFRLNPGDSVFAPRRIPHCWAHVGEGTGRIVFALTPAGKIEPFFRALSAANAMAPQDPAFWRRFDLELVGPPLAFE
jgi:quercetin dioxygenase-like cupin family protein